MNHEQNSMIPREIQFGRFLGIARQSEFLLLILWSDIDSDEVSARKLPSSWGFATWIGRLRFRQRWISDVEDAMSWKGNDENVFEQNVRKQKKRVVRRCQTFLLSNSNSILRIDNLISMWLCSLFKEPWMGSRQVKNWQSRTKLLPFLQNHKKLAHWNARRGFEF